MKWVMIETPQKVLCVPVDKILVVAFSYFTKGVTMHHGELLIPIDNSPEFLKRIQKIFDEEKIKYFAKPKIIIRAEAVKYPEDTAQDIEFELKPFSMRNEYSNIIIKKFLGEFYSYVEKREYELHHQEATNFFKIPDKEMWLNFNNIIAVEDWGHSVYVFATQTKEEIFTPHKEKIFKAARENNFKAVDNKLLINPRYIFGCRKETYGQFLLTPIGLINWIDIDLIEAGDFYLNPQMLPITQIEIDKTFAETEIDINFSYFSVYTRICDDFSDAFLALPAFVEQINKDAEIIFETI